MLTPDSSERFARVGGLDLCYETFGDDQAPALLLVMGLGSQMILWEDEFCVALAGHGLRVVRFDNRDIGRSTILRQSRPPTLRQLVLRDPRGGQRTRLTTWPPTPPGCSISWGSMPRTSSEPRWVG